MRAELHRNLLIAHGEPAVDAWLDAVPAALDRWCAKWAMTISNDLPISGYNFMVYGDSAIAGPVVLKMNIPSPEVHSEIEAIAQTSGRGIVRMVDADPDLAIMMLERVYPGTPLKTADISDCDSTVIGAGVMRRFGGHLNARITSFHFMTGLLRYSNIRHAPPTRSDRSRCP